MIYLFEALDLFYLERFIRFVQMNLLFERIDESIDQRLMKRDIWQDCNRSRVLILQLLEVQSINPNDKRIDPSPTRLNFDVYKLNLARVEMRDVVRVAARNDQ